MISVAAPLWLLALGVCPVIWWLHRARGHGRPLFVASVLLFREAAAPRSAGARAPVADPAWRRRAAIAALLALALAGGSLRGTTRDIVVWVDDGPTMATREAGGTRLALAFAALRNALPRDPAVRIELRSLAEPGLRYAAAGGGARAARDATQWLLTDGSNAALQAWIRSGAIERVIRVGTQTENVGLTTLAVRTHLSDPERLDGVVTVFNAGRAAARRELELHAGRIGVLRQTLALAPGESRTLDFSLPRPERGSPPLEALLTPHDALADDDHLELTARALERTRVRIGSDCPDALRNAVAAQTDLALAGRAGGTGVQEPVAAADLVIACGADDVAEGSLPTLLLAARSRGAPTDRAGDAREIGVEAEWSPSASAALSETLLPRTLVLVSPRPEPPAGAEALLRARGGIVVWRMPGAPRRVGTSIDLGAPALRAAPEYPLLVGELLELASGEPLLARVAAATRDPRTTRIAPAGMDGTAAQGAAGHDADADADPDAVRPATVRARRERAGFPLAPLWVAIAALLLLWDLARSLRATTRIVRAERGS